jgi:hypothetical protein
MRKPYLYLTISSCIALSGIGLAEDVKKDTAPLDEAARKTARTTFSLPTPGEMLRAADGKIDIKKLTAALGAPPALDPKSSDEAQAHQLGICLADGFISLYAKDADKVKANGKLLLAIATHLGADEAIIAEGKNIGTLVDGEKWSEAFTSADTFRTRLLKSLVQDGDMDLVTVASASGWLRGFGVAANEMAQSYDGTTSRLLRQPELATYLAEAVLKLPAGAIEDSAKAAAALKEISTLSAVAQDADIPKESVAKIAQQAKEGLAALAGKAVTKP